MDLDKSEQLIRVLVVDDHPLLRGGIAAVLDGAPDLQLIAEAGSGQEAIDAFRTHHPDVTLMDLQMEGMDGVSATEAIRAEWPDARVLMLTTYGGDGHAVRALKAGASGYLLKSMIRKDLPDAIRAVHAGRRRIPAEVAEALASHFTDDALSPRELDVLQRIARGNSNRRVASQLSISEDTVKTHMKNIMSKLGANDRTHAVMIALKRGMIEM
ncbi:DNA-binding response regulator [Steroidobacter agaridevorans]|uniref:DNA-binding response regulator n=1 Tax=Steroidobacter agaridevorans TaxID=2695856 RepID=A0A829YL72_9GAMM|nr:response regulator transcription factor [Steroidobacter agaridevorans]GFE84174.1 DNA-binding response regulator [Steroidobacter agaridevorans]GFE86996.1 DNA-binding response regulator [Steroidobacter agaridevorans]